MKAGIISFTGTGFALAKKLAGILKREGYEALASVKCAGLQETLDCSVSEWVGAQFRESDAIIFVGAAGIAVRQIAPYLRSKLTDPAVIVFDERGKYAVPILSGHVGGANALALLLCRETGAEAVITTATDVQGKWAADVFAARNGLVMDNSAKVKTVSAKVLRGEKLTMYVEGGAREITGAAPDCLRVVTGGPPDGPPPDIRVGIFRYPGETSALCLIPRAVCVGIGCRKGAGEQAIAEAVGCALEQAGVWEQSIGQVASIDLKAGEEGLRSYCSRRGLEFMTYSADELMAAKGEFSSSDFVEKTTGADNVCERSAVTGAGGGRLLVRKQVHEGVTVALAVRKWGVHFE